MTADRTPVWRVEMIVPLALVVAFVAVAAVDIAAFPYHEWDALAYGEWSRLIAEHWRLHFAPITDQTYHRPLLYVLQGVVWGVFGFSERLGRGVDLIFALILLGALFELGRRAVNATCGAFAAAITLLVPEFQRGAFSGLTDVPAAAMVGVAGVAVLAASPVLIALAACAAVLTKPSTLPALAGLALAASIGPRADLRRRIGRLLVPLAVGVVVALVYDGAQASRLHEGLVPFLRAGSTGVYATLAAQARAHALLEAGWLGGTLRLLLLYSIVYGLLRSAAVKHRDAARVALVASAFGSYVGPLAAAHFRHLGVGPLDGWSHALGFVAVLVTLSATLRPSSLVPPRTFQWLLLWASPPVFVWLWSGAYDMRLLSPAWPPLIVLCAIVLDAAIVSARRIAWPLAIPAAVALIVAISVGLENVDGVGGPRWRQVQSSPSGFFDLAANRDLFLPQFDDVLRAITPVAGSGGRILSSDGKFRFYFPGRAVQTYPRRCADLTGFQVFVLLTDDDSRSYMETVLHTSADPAFWSKCKAPRLTQIAQSGTFTAFRVG